MLENDYKAIVWAWGVLKQFHETKDDPQYWRDLLKAISEHDGDGIAWQKFGDAVVSILDYRHN